MEKKKIELLMDYLRFSIFSDIYNRDSDAELKELLFELIGEEEANTFLKGLPQIKKELLTDVEALANNDPAASDRKEIILCYPGLTAMLHYRVAHRMLVQKIPILPRFITELAHSATGIDIHPGATIGEYFAIDHGTGVVIGATTIIGNHVMLYQGVTLGARNFKYDTGGRPINLPRHPVLEDNVTVYSNTSILGNVHIGHDTVIGGNIWLTHDVPPYSRILQGKALYMSSYEDGEGI